MAPGGPFENLAGLATLDLVQNLAPLDPAALLARLAGDGGTAAARATAATPAAASPSGALPRDFPALVRVVEQSGRHLLAQQLHDQVGLVRFEPPELALKPTRPLGADWSRELAAVLRTLTGAAWQVALSDDNGAPSLLDQERMAEERVRAEVLADPNVAAALQAFPGAELESYTTRGG